jgi:hypothetical protein
MTESDWLALAREHRAGLKFLVRSYHPSSLAPRGLKLPITAPSAETACDAAREQIARTAPADPVARFNRAIASGQIGDLYSVLSQTWHGIPESTEAHRLIGFLTLCDLLDDPPEEAP